ncbi:hypothetical protein P4S72_24335 [Vibrio sp. PP-XX7]
MGIFYYFNSKKDLDKSIQNYKILGDLGLNYKVLYREQLIDEYGMNELPNDVYGAIYSIDCRKGDCHKFTLGLMDKCKQYDTFLYKSNVAVEKLIKKTTL